MRLCLIALVAIIASTNARKKGGKYTKLDTSDVVNPDPRATGPVTAEYNMNEELTEGDMLGAKKSSDNRNAVNEVYKLWPQGTVPYQFHESVTDDLKAVINQAIDDYNKYTCIKWVERNGEEDHVTIKANSGGCFAWLGRSGGEQPINLGNGCWYKGTVIHEMLHTLGFAHEQARGDRDKYIEIHWDNIPKSKHSQFEKMAEGTENNQGFPYDFSSVMHYSTYAFTTDWSKATITTRDPKNQDKIGNRAGFSKQDIKEVNKLYKCRNGKSMVAGKNGCLDKDRDYCENVLGLKNGPNQNCNYPDLKVYCKISCKVCDPNGNSGPRPSPNTPKPDNGNCKDENKHYCEDTLGLKNGPNRVCKSEPHANYCKKSCGKC